MAALTHDDNIIDIIVSFVAFGAVLALNIAAVLWGSLFELFSGKQRPLEELLRY
jgi:hypothetical protein